VISRDHLGKLASGEGPSYGFPEHGPRAACFLVFEYTIHGPEGQHLIANLTQEYRAGSRVPV
jgi:hypothetical protein